MPITDKEFQAIMADKSKFIAGDLDWIAVTGTAFEFRAKVESDAGYPLIVKAWLNRAAEKLSFTVTHRRAGRIYGLDIGAVHKNPTGELVGDPHLHSWTEIFADKKAHMPEDITAGFENSGEAWKWFCRKANIEHKGVLKQPPPEQLELPL